MTWRVIRAMTIKRMDMEAVQRHDRSVIVLASWRSMCEVTVRERGAVNSVDRFLEEQSYESICKTLAMLIVCESEAAHSG